MPAFEKSQIVRDLLFREGEIMMKKILCLFVFMLITVAVFSVTLNRNGVNFYWEYNLKPTDYDKAKVSKNVNGDTIRIMLDGKEEIIRMIGVDTPETVKASTPVEFFGKEASNFTKTMLPVGSEVYVSYDWDPRDQYNRLLAYVWYSQDGQWILHNLSLVSNGYGNAFTSFSFDEDYMGIFIEAERMARKQGRGLWEKVQSNTDTSSSIVISYVQYSGAKEYVELQNKGNTDVSLKGWKLVSTSGNEVYTFGDVTFKAGSELKVFSGPKAEGILVWTKEFVHGNNGDSVELYDAVGRRVDSERW
jgi:micrococcal nuclease